jgi:dGTPase
MSEPIRAAADRLRDFLFERVYEPLNQRPDTDRAQHLVRTMFAYFEAAPARIPTSESAVIRTDTPARQAADFISSMTDRYAVELFESLYVPRFWQT